MGLTLGPVLTVSASVTTWNFMTVFPCRHVCSFDYISFMHVLLCGHVLVSLDTGIHYCICVAFITIKSYKIWCNTNLEFALFSRMTDILCWYFPQLAIVGRHPGPIVGGLQPCASRQAVSAVMY